MAATLVVGASALMFLGGGVMGYAIGHATVPAPVVQVVVLHDAPTPTPTPSPSVTVIANGTAPPCQSWDPNAHGSAPANPCP